MKLADVERLAVAGESEDMELKKSTSQLRRAAETICGFLKGTGGNVLIGVTLDVSSARPSYGRAATGGGSTWALEKADEE